MKKTFPFIALAAIALMISACKKDAAAISPNPSLTITSPTQGQSFAAGSSLHITGTATASGSDDAHLLHELSITITRASDGTQVWFADISVHDEQSHSIDTSFALPHPSVRDSLVISTEVVNHLLNKATQKVGITVNP